MIAADRDLAGQSIADVLMQLRCEKCGQKPIRVALEEDAAATYAAPLDGQMRVAGGAGWLMRDPLAGSSLVAGLVMMTVHVRHAPRP